MATAEMYFSDRPIIDSCDAEVSDARRNALMSACASPAKIARRPLVPIYAIREDEWPAEFHELSARLRSSTGTQRKPCGAAIHTVLLRLREPGTHRTLMLRPRGLCRRRIRLDTMSFRVRHLHGSRVNVMEMRSHRNTITATGRASNSEHGDSRDHAVPSWPNLVRLLHHRTFSLAIVGAVIFVETTGRRQR